MSLKSRLKALEQYQPVDVRQGDIKATRKRCEMILLYCDPDDTRQIERCRETIRQIDAGVYELPGPFPAGDMDARARIVRERMLKDFRSMEV